MTDEQKEANGLIPPKIKVTSPTSPSTVRMVRLKKPSEKSETSRIDLSEAEASDLPEPTVKSGLNIKDVFGKPVMPAISSTPKAETSRVDLEQAEEADPLVRIARDAALNRTARISLDEPPEAAQPSTAKSMDYTTHINLEGAGMDEAPVPPQTKEGTRRVTIDDLATALPRDEESPKPIKTVRLQRPTSVPKTVVLSRPGAAPVEKPEPPAAPAIMERPESNAGATARIDVPPEAMEPTPSTQRKTIRIKRPDGSPTSTSKTVSLTRQPKISLVKAPAAEESEASAASPVLSKQAQRLLLNDMEDTPGTAFSVMSLVALLIAMALVYLLVAEFMGFPLPGRLI